MAETSFADMCAIHYEQKPCANCAANSAIVPSVSDAGLPLPEGWRGGARRPAPRTREVFSGCRCKEGECHSERPATCLGVLARGRGPLATQPCRDGCTGRADDWTWHDAAGLCLRCGGAEGQAPQQEVDKDTGMLRGARSAAALNAEVDREAE